MVNDEKQRGRAVIDDCGPFGVTKDGECAFEIGATVPSVTCPEVQLYIIIGRGDVAQDFARALRQRRAPEICVNDNAGAVDHRLDATRAKFFNRSANKINNVIGMGDFAAPSNLSELAPDKIDNERS